MGFLSLIPYIISHFSLCFRWRVAIKYIYIYWSTICYMYAQWRRGHAAALPPFLPAKISKPLSICLPAGFILTPSIPLAPLPQYQRNYKSNNFFSILFIYNIHNLIIPFSTYNVSYYIFQLTKFYFRVRYMFFFIFYNVII